MYLDCISLYPGICRSSYHQTDKAEQNLNMMTQYLLLSYILQNCFLCLAVQIIEVAFASYRSATAATCKKAQIRITEK